MIQRGFKGSFLANYHIFTTVLLIKTPFQFGICVSFCVCPNDSSDTTELDRGSEGTND